MGSIYVAKYAAIHMAKQKSGTIILVSSSLGSEGQRGFIAYSASKGALDAMTLPMARDLGKYGIRVVAIAPGLIKTDIMNSMSEASKKSTEKIISKLTPMNALGEREDFSHFV